jgi:hypothetical protein
VDIVSAFRIVSTQSDQAQLLNLPQKPKPTERGKMARRRYIALALFALPLTGRGESLHGLVKNPPAEPGALSL